MSGASEVGLNTAFSVSKFGLLLFIKKMFGLLLLSPGNGDFMFAISVIISI